MAAAWRAAAAELHRLAQQPEVLFAPIGPERIAAYFHSAEPLRAARRSGADRVEREVRSRGIGDPECGVDRQTERVGHPLGEKHPQDLGSAFDQ